MHMPLYYAHFVIVEENQWLNRSAPHDVIREEKRHRVETQLFAASDAEEAYIRAVDMISGFEDAHNDGPRGQDKFQMRRNSRHR
jgi:hypothetical protein